MYSLMNRVFSTLLQFAREPSGITTTSEESSPTLGSLPTPIQRAAINIVLSISNLDSTTKASITKYLQLSATRLSTSGLIDSVLGVASPAGPLVTQETVNFRCQGLNAINSTSLDDLDLIPEFEFSAFGPATLAMLDGILEVDRDEDGVPKLPKIASFHSLLHSLGDDQVALFQSPSSHTWRCSSVFTGIRYPEDDMPDTPEAIYQIPLNQIRETDATAHLSILPPSVIDAKGFPDPLSSPAYLKSQRRASSPPTSNIVEPSTPVAQLPILPVAGNGLSGLLSSPRCYEKIPQQTIVHLNRPVSFGPPDFIHPPPRRRLDFSSGTHTGLLDSPGLVDLSLSLNVDRLSKFDTRSFSNSQLSPPRILHQRMSSDTTVDGDGYLRVPCTPEIEHLGRNVEFRFPQSQTMQEEEAGVDLEKVMEEHRNFFQFKREESVKEDDMFAHWNSNNDYGDDGERKDDPQRELLSADGDLSLVLLSILGSGAYGRVMSAWCQQLRRYVAVKVLHKPMHDEWRAGMSYLELELKILKATTQLYEQQSEGGGAFLLKLIRSWQDNNNVYFVMDMYSHDLRRLLREVPIGLHDVRLYAAELVLAFQSFHGLRVMHRDIKPENILVSPTGHLCIADYGMSKAFFEPKYTKRPPRALKAYDLLGTSGYYAPELLRNYDRHTKRLTVGYGFEADIWSFGMVLLDMFVGDGRMFFDAHAPSHEETHEERLERLDENVMYMPLELDKWVKDPDARHLLSKILDRNPKTRATLDQIKAHPFFACLDWDKVARRQYTPDYIPPPIPLTFKPFPSRNFSTFYSPPGVSTQHMSPDTRQMYMDRKQMRMKRETGDLAVDDPDFDWCGNYMLDYLHGTSVSDAEPAVRLDSSGDPCIHASGTSAFTQRSSFEAARNSDREWHVEEQWPF